MTTHSKDTRWRDAADRSEYLRKLEDKYWEQQWLIGEYEEIIYHRLHKPMLMYVPLDQSDQLE